MENQVTWSQDQMRQVLITCDEDFGSHSQCDRVSLGVESRVWPELIGFSKGGSFWLLGGNRSSQDQRGSQEMSHEALAFVQMREDSGQNQGDTSGRGKKGQT